MKKGTFALIIAAAAVLFILAVLLIKLISGAVSIVSGVLNALLGLAVILSLIIIVVWMFRYAARRK